MSKFIRYVLKTIPLRQSPRKARKTWKFSIGNDTILKDAVLVVAVISGASLFAYRQFRTQKEDDSQPKRITERLFLKFATLEYKGQAFMTPQDFLESVLETSPRITRGSRLVISEQVLSRIRRKTPTKSENSAQFFRSLKTNGLISYSDYLFLLSVIVKPYSDFEICFKILDTDYSNTIEREEYLIMEKTFSRKWKSKHGLYGKDNVNSVENEELIDDEFGLQSRFNIDTTLRYHLFGKTGQEKLNFEDFKKFLLNVQRELLEIEFQQFSRGLPFITELDFALILFRYSLTQDYNFEKFLKCKISKNIISFDDYLHFMNFLYMLGDFVFALRFYTQTQKKISRKSFHEVFQMMKGHNLSFLIIDTVFNMFDVDDSGYIFYQDFINVMNDRLNRGLRKKPDEKRSYWSSFIRCLRDHADVNSSKKFYERMNKIC